MKRIWAGVLAVSMLAGTAASAEAGAEIQVVIDEKQVKGDQAPVLQDGTTMVPFRSLFEELGASVAWNAEQQVVTATKRGVTIVLRVGSDQAQVGGKAAPLAKPVQIIGGRTMVPLRFVGEALGADVKWLGASSTVEVTSAERILLALASQEKSAEALALLEKGVDVNAVSPNARQTALHFAARNGDGVLVKALLAAGAKGDVADAYGYTPLLYASETDNVDSLVKLLEHGARPNAVSAEGMTPLLSAAQYGTSQMVQALLQAGADKTATAPDGTNALMLAARVDNSDVVGVLLQAGMDAAEETESGWTALSLAADFDGKAVTVDRLLRAGANPNSRFGEFGYAPLLSAAGLDKNDVMKLLLAAGADPNLGDEYGWTPLMLTAGKGNVAGMKLLLEAKADLTLRNEEGLTALDWAAETGRFEAFELLYEAGDRSRTFPSSVERFTDEEFMARTAPELTATIIHGKDQNDYGLNPTQAMMFIHLNEENVDGFWILSEANKKKMLFEQYRNHAADVQGVSECYAYIAYGGRAILGAAMTPGIELRDVDVRNFPSVLVPEE